MRFMIIYFILSVTAVFALAADYDDIAITDILSDSQLESVGYSKLSNSEKEALRLVLIDLFVNAYGKGRAKGLEEAASLLAEAGSVQAGTIESQIDGEFEGWEGETIVKLVNGQIWQQSEYYYTYHYAFMPDVLVFMSGGRWKMKVEGVDRTVGVTQLR